MMAVGMRDKQAAFEFLSAFHKRLEAELVSPAAIEADIRGAVRDAKAHHSQRHLRQPEAAFLNRYVIPRLYAQMQSDLKLSDEAAKHSLLNEYHPSMREYSTHSPASTFKHPFSKGLGTGARQIYDRWMQRPGVKGSPQIQSCPDFAIRSPAPFSIVFEGKYFPSGSIEYAERELATDIYQAFFYRGLPPAPEKRGRAAWDYTFACLLAYDASPGGTLGAAWRALPHAVREGFWKGGNVYVMILGGQGRPKG